MPPDMPPWGWCTRGWVSIQCELDKSQYPRLSVPIAAPSDLARRPDLDSYTDAGAVGVGFQTAPRSEQRCERERYRKSETDC